MELPTWLAVREHVPTATMVTMFPATVQTAWVVEANVTVRPDVAVAVTATGVAPKLTFGGAVNVTVCAAEAMVKLRDTGVAAAMPALPGWVAVREQVPAETILTVDPATVQTDVVVDAKLTGRPEVAVALSVKGAAPNVRFGGPLKVIALVPATMLND